MNYKISICRLILYLFICYGLNACNNSENKGKKNSRADSAVSKTVKSKPDKTKTTYQRPPIIQIVDSVSPKRTVIYCADSAANFDRVSLKLGNIYGVILAAHIKKNNLKTTGAPMAWYKKQKAPYFFEAGFPVNKPGSKPTNGVKTREISAGKAVIAHFFGPYELLPQAYESIREWMKENKKIGNGAPYEIYLTDPIDENSKPLDPYKVQTDIIFPIR